MSTSKKRRFRLRHVFWLDQLKEDEALLTELIAWLKEQGRFHQCVTRGLWIASDLEEGKLDALYLLYPFTRHLLTGQGQAAATESEYGAYSMGEGGDIEISAPSPEQSAAAVTNFLNSLDSF